MLKETFKYRLFLLWTLYAGVMSFLLWLSWELQILTKLFSTDPTKITYVVGLFFIGGTIHCGVRSWYLSKQINAATEIKEGSKVWQDDESLPAKFMQAINKSILGQPLEAEKLSDSDLLADVFAEQTRAQHEVGWFFTSLLVKLGLLGTVIGFVLMLTPLSTLESFDIEDIQGILANMTAGMAVALNTTLVGLLGSMLLSFQYLMLDRGADELVARVIEYVQTELVPSLKNSGR